MPLSLKLRRRIRAVSRRTRELRMIARGLASTDHVVLAHLIPMRRCNLSCTYCNEYDKVSNPVSVPEMRRRIDHLKRLGTNVVTISGGEPLMHPELDDVIRYIRSRGIIAGLITNGYLLTQKRIEQLNEAGLDHLQISIDNVQPDEVSKKSLKVLDKKLQLLAQHAVFHVNINSVLGSGVKTPEDAIVIANRALALGFTSTVGIIHDGSGQLRPLDPIEHAIYDRMKLRNKKSYSKFARFFQDNIADGKPNDWRCRAGARYLYICEDGLVHYCSQQRGYPGVPLEKYTVENVRREFRTEKPCAPHCTVSCVHQISLIDGWRAPQHILPAPPEGEFVPDLVQIQVEGD
jgi:MoaA/NifB/PqqE/SkfB family radical SAM enzyme